ncbi:MAG: D-sedoheptulose-7-phosphate isomerase [Solirubrobacteraceae bacterium]
MADPLRHARRGGRVTDGVRAAEADFFALEADRTARLCEAMSERFAAGGRLLAIGHSPQARSDARHVAVEFVHPVIVGKRALPALALTAEAGPPHAIVEPGDIVIAFDGETGERGLRIAYDKTTAADWCFEVQAEDEFQRQELIETHYHLLWELVHVFFEHRGGGTRDGGRASFLYPFLSAQGSGAQSVVADVAASVVMKAQEIAALRKETLAENAAALEGAARAAGERLDAGGRLLLLGNGGSATDAMDAAADCRFPPADCGALRPRSAIDLAEDSGIITAVANDVGIEDVFSRQLIAHGRSTDVLLAFSTSGDSRNVIRALAEGRRIGLETIAMVGYDGGRIASERLADHVILTRSQHIPRIQEAQASAWHALRKLIG